MKSKLLLLAVLGVAVCACGTKQKSKMDRAIDTYALVKIDAPDLSGISDNGKEVLNLYKFAARSADKIYWKQVFGDEDEMNHIADEATREFAMINYGPWDRRTGKAFVDGYGDMPKGFNFYPADMTTAQFDSLSDPNKTSPYTLIQKDGDSLKVVWYHDAYASDIETITTCLKTAADITIVPSVRKYLLKKIEALRTDNYYESDLAWLNMTDSKMDLVLGPDEVNDDALYGLKKSYEAFVLLKNLKRTEELSKFASRTDMMQEYLPCKPEYKTFKPGRESNIFVCNALYYAGAANVGTKLIAINLPFDEKVQAEKGTRTILMENIINAKYNKILSPAANVLLDTQNNPIDAESFFWNIAFREVAHGLGVKETINGKGTVSEALGNMAQIIEETKGDALGAYLACNLAESHQLNLLSSRKSTFATFLVSMIRSGRFGNVDAIGKGNIICYNYLKSKGAFTRSEGGKYTINDEDFQQGLADLVGEIIEIQATGDVEAAKKFDATYSTPDKEMKADFANLRLEKIPIDLRFEYDW